LRSASGSNSKELILIFPTELSSGHGETANLDSLRRHVAFYVTSMGEYYAKTLSNAGFSTLVAEAKSAYARGEMSEAEAKMSSELIEQTCLFGSPQSIKTKLDRLPSDVEPVLGFRISTIEEIRDSISALRSLAQ
jgi:hypothetical protein